MPSVVVGGNCLLSVLAIALTTDASDYADGAVGGQCNQGNRWPFSASSSGIMSTKYSTFDWELLCLLLVIRLFDLLICFGPDAR